MGEEVLKSMEEGMRKSLDFLQVKLTKIRTGRASITMLDGITVEAYGSEMPLNQVASLAVPEARLITIQPWDKTVVPVIEKAIMKSSLGIMPTTQGDVIRIPVPDLTEDRRKELSKNVRALGEEAKISVRNVRRDARALLDKKMKAGELPEDDHKKMSERLQKSTDGWVGKIDGMVKVKESEVMEV